MAVADWFDYSDIKRRCAEVHQLELPTVGGGARDPSSARRKGPSKGVPKVWRVGEWNLSAIMLQFGIVQANHGAWGKHDNDTFPSEFQSIKIPNPKITNPLGGEATYRFRARAGTDTTPVRCGTAKG